jgi:YegS/Rv2252/BmrU family lipid kinase
MNNTNEWLVIVNPNAGHGRGKKDWPVIASLLDKYDIQYKVCFTLTRRHAIVLTQEGILDGYRKIIAIGGDGTLNEIVNGIFMLNSCSPTDITLSMIMVGTGNDWGKLFGIPTHYELAVQVIKDCRTRSQDVGKVSFYDGIQKESRYFINIAGLGFDAVVVNRTNLTQDKGYKGKAIYFINLLRSLLVYRHTHTSVEIDGKRIQHDVLSISIGIGKYSGGGMMQTPHALPNDGLFDITIIRKMSKWEVVMSLKKLYDGTLLTHPKIEGYKGKEILIDSDPLIHLETDGESLGHSPIQFKLLPNSLNVVCGAICAF